MQELFVGDLPATDSASPEVGPPTNFTSENTRHPYHTYKVRTRYVWNDGMTSMAVAGPNGTAAEVIKVSAACGMKIVEWTATRHGANPQIPTPTSTDENQVRHSFEVVTESPDMMADGTYVYTVSGKYVYLLRKPVDFTDNKFFMGSGGQDLTPPTAHVINTGDFLTNISS